MVRGLMTTPTTPASPLTFKHELQPDWGAGLVVQDLGKHWVVFFEKAGEKKFVKDKAAVLVPVQLDPDALAALQAKATGRKAKAAPRPSAAHRPASKVRPKKTAAPRFATFAEQLALFEKLFAGGFQGEAYVKNERGAAGAEGSRDAAVALAQQALSAEAFASRSPDELFASAQQVLSATNFVFPIEGPIPFRQLEGEDRAKALAALKDLLHGAGDYADRVERFAGSLTLKDAKGVAKKVTWPLATVFGALFAPAEHTCVKPTAFAGQALTLGVSVEKTQPVNAAGYRLFLEVVKKTDALLREAGQQPRDLLDVYTFIWRTHGHKSSAE